jgi:hypothetical protein
MEVSGQLHDPAWWTTQSNSITLRMKTEKVFETSVSTKAEPHYPAENPKELLH